MTTKLDWYPWYWQLYAGSPRTQRMTLAAEGLYRRMLDLQWKLGAVPDSPDAVADLIAKPAAQIRRSWASARRQFDVRPDGQLSNATLARIRAEQEAKHERRVKAGRNGGRLKAQAAQRLASNAIAMPSNAVAMPSNREEKNTSLNYRATRPRPSGGGGPVAVSEIVGVPDPASAAGRLRAEVA